MVFSGFYAYYAYAIIATTGFERRSPQELKCTGKFAYELLPSRP